MFPQVEMNTSVPEPLSVTWSNDDCDGCFRFGFGTPIQQLQLAVINDPQKLSLELPVHCLLVSDNDTTNNQSWCRQDPRSTSSFFDPAASSTWRAKKAKNGTSPNDTNVDGFFEPFFGDDGSDKLTIGARADNKATEAVRSVDIAMFFSRDVPQKGAINLALEHTNASLPMRRGPSLLESLKQQEKIASLSWAYGAAGSRSDSRTYSSLVLGGYDANKFVGTRVPHFDLEDSKSASLKLSIISISAGGLKFNGEDTGSVELLNQPVTAAINISEEGYIFDKLTYANFKTVANKAKEKLLEQTAGTYSEIEVLTPDNDTFLSWDDAYFVFGLANATDTRMALNITLPLTAFTNYYENHVIDDDPLHQLNLAIKEGPEGADIVLGRPFLRHQYLITDYERRRFSLHEAVFSTLGDSASSLTVIPAIPIQKQKELFTNPQTTSQGLSPKEIAGIGTATIVSAILSFVLTGYIITLRKYRKSRIRPPYKYKGKPELDASDAAVAGLVKVEVDPTSRPDPELNAGQDGVPRRELSTLERPGELRGTETQHELVTRERPGEMRGCAAENEMLASPNEVFELPA